MWKEKEKMRIRADNLKGMLGVKRNEKRRDLCNVRKGGNILRW